MWRWFSWLLICWLRGEIGALRLLHAAAADLPLSLPPLSLLIAVRLPASHRRLAPSSLALRSDYTVSHNNLADLQCDSGTGSVGGCLSLISLVISPPPPPSVIRCRSELHQHPAHRKLMSFMCCLVFVSASSPPAARLFSPLAQPPPPPR